MNRYEKQLLLPELTQGHQDLLKNTKLLMVGAGGLGAPALPYLAGAGIGHITIVDDDVVDISNLHRQTIFKTSDAGKNKAELTAAYLKELNPQIKVTAVPQKLNPGDDIDGFDIILDGTDNFESKQLLNELSIRSKTPLVAASVEGFNGTAAIFAGFDKNLPCYHCMFPELPIDCKSCVGGGILGTVAGLAGLYQAHLTLCFLLDIGDVKPGTVLSLDFKTMRTQQLSLAKNLECTVCGKAQYGAKRQTSPAQVIPLIHPDELDGHIVVDVRTFEEVATDPIDSALHMQLDTIPERYVELPTDRPIAFICRSNVRSRRAAEYLYARGYKNVCVLDALAA
ncbi:MAG: HesA/MoeB/ThiF family protein [Alphaproteobacteria bacterium]